MPSLLQRLDKNFVNKAFINKKIKKQINIEIVEKQLLDC